MLETDPTAPVHRSKEGTQPTYESEVSHLGVWGDYWRKTYLEGIHKDGLNAEPNLSLKILWHQWRHAGGSWDAGLMFQGDADTEKREPLTKFWGSLHFKIDWYTKGLTFPLWLKRNIRGRERQQTEISPKPREDSGEDGRVPTTYQLGLLISLSKK